MTPCQVSILQFPKTQSTHHLYGWAKQHLWSSCMPNLQQPQMGLAGDRISLWVWVHGFHPQNTPKTFVFSPVTLAALVLWPWCMFQLSVWIKTGYCELLSCQNSDAYMWHMLELLTLAKVIRSPKKIIVNCWFVETIEKEIFGIQLIGNMSNHGWREWQFSARHPFSYIRRGSQTGRTQLRILSCEVMSSLMYTHVNKASQNT